MLKLRKIFSLGLTVAAVAALGVMVSSCVEPVDSYSVKIWWGDAETEEQHKEQRPNASGARDNYEAGDPVTITAGTAPSGMVFYMWTSSPEVNFGNAKSSTTTFTMPAGDVIVTAWFVNDESDADIRYTWEAAEQSKILYIAASKKDVADWYRDVYNQVDYVEEDASETPLFGGSPDIPDNIYSKTIGSTQYKGKYLPIKASGAGTNFVEGVGMFTAVCTGKDEFGDFDIVANYVILEYEEAEMYLYYEVAFDVGTFTDPDDGGDGETAWFYEVATDKDTKPWLEKAPLKAKPKVKKLTKTLNNGASVTYYFLRRAAK